MEAGAAQASRPQESPRRPRKSKTPVGSPSKSQTRSKNAQSPGRSNSKNMTNSTDITLTQSPKKSNKPNATNLKSPTVTTSEQSTNSEVNATNSPQNAALTNVANLESPTDSTSVIKQSPNSEVNSANTPQKAALTNASNSNVPSTQQSSSGSESKPNAANSSRRTWTNSGGGGRKNWRSNSPEQVASVQDGEDPEPEDKVHISGFPPYTQSQDISKIFSRFGEYRVEKFNPRLSYAVLQYKTKEEAREAIKQTNKKAAIYGKFLYVRIYTAVKTGPQAPKQEFVMTKQRGEIIDPKNIDLTGEFSEQVDRILNSVRLTQEEATSISALYADVERVLQSQWPGCVAMPFGSITTGLGIKSSDADCYVHVPASSQRGDSPALQALLIAKARKILLSHPTLFTEILPIPRANTPIIKFFHLPTSTNCDLSFKTPLGAQNSRLIAFLLHSDPRLIPLAVLIKYWAKVHGISGTGKLTNYALTMMIIFYVQNPSVSILPPVEQLQRDRKLDIIVDYWNTGFVQTKDAIPPSTNTYSILELFGGFFHFYSKFDFQKYVVCPYMGKVIEKKVFQEITDLPKEFERYVHNVINGYTPTLRVNTPVVVQDPFEQSHNVASPISLKLACEIQAYCKFASETYIKDEPKGCQNLLHTILLKRPKITKYNPRPEFRFGIFPKITTCITEPDWKSVIRKVMLQMFDPMLKIKLDKIQERTTETLKDKEKYKGVITKQIWKRKKFNKLYNCINMELAAKQTRITEEVLNVEKEAISLVFTLTLTFSNESRNTATMIKLVKGDVEHFSEFGKFFVNDMYVWFKTLIEPYLNTTPAEAATKLAESLKVFGDIDTTLDSDDDSAVDSENEKANTEEDDNTVNKENIEISNDPVPNAAAMAT